MLVMHLIVFILKLSIISSLVTKDLEMYLNFRKNLKIEKKVNIF